MDRDLVLTKGREVAGKLLIELQVRKSTADGPGARKFYNDLTKPIDGWEGEIRDVVLAKKQVWNLAGTSVFFFTEPLYSFQPRKIFIQPNTFLVDGEVQLKEYPLTPAGAIESFIERNL